MYIRFHCKNSNHKDRVVDLRFTVFRKVDSSMYAYSPLFPLSTSSIVHDRDPLIKTAHARYSVKLYRAV